MPTRLRAGFGGARDGTARPSPAPPEPLHPGGYLLPPGLIVIAMLADNSIVARGVPDDLLELKAVLALMDVPRPQFRIRVFMGALSAEGLAMADTDLRLTDSARGERMSLVATAHLGGDGAVEVKLGGSISSHGATHPTEARVRLHPGRSTEIISFGSGARRVRVWARVDLAANLATADSSPGFH